MSIQPHQLLVLLIYAVLIFTVYKAKPYWIKGIALWIMIIVFFVSPVRFKQVGGESLERSTHKFNNIPEKVEFKKESFNESQDRELEALKQQSEDNKDEVHN